ncbi:bifunctional 5,10-methylene-tetrahydrofolate dehydrogenase/5,10-methylene-tetrahydrofolate cyclohydrolase [Candidatus Gracilibacteria bacterium]|nr:bifunctional 5,10-methylene-tetrahydrofolate dehydrogenase/5,10-methylene-tetrahydrofolate cyclohydrolase [Candidatus Gracilibacteria bacterium]MCF7856153.1 bifunctional 5,10-methylene-tetrahydrofolate dehydrogenase/5,10-methylene-tetrahydrofolate cyclohydrolase [Candidatus Gracilibacteria bacterium]MCF7896619.1 bifunctional 5,10-methylene-tetrahydrofolate dehydrogenase/5,10-methylene-tetrahydrofolate cyclohydrolase [Candidatus Gracilibacteria bacterium]
MILDGKKLSAKILNSVKRKIVAKKLKIGLAVIIVGRHSASLVYVHQKKLAAEKVGMRFYEKNFPTSISEKQLLQEIEKLNRDKKIQGFIVQLPLPRQISTRKILEKISPAKDVDGFHPLNLGRGLLDLSTLLPATPAGILRLLDFYKIPLKSKNVVVVGHSNIVGKPLAMLLINRDATVTVCHEFTKNLASFTKNADIVISATGVPKLIRAKMLKRNCVVVDCGCAKVDTGLVGDVDFDSVKKIASAITPVPGGVGPMTVAILIENTYFASQNKF